jgi:phenylalanyl-tRNA synthetase beta chain
VPNAVIIGTIRESAGELLKNTQLVDMYRGGQIPDGKQSLTYRLEYQNISRTLEDKEVQDAHSRVVSALQEKLGAALR